MAGSKAPPDRGVAQNPAPPTDAAVIRLSLNDSECFEELFHRHAPRIQRYVVRHRREEIRLYRALAKTGTDPVIASFTDRSDDRVTAGAASPRLAAALAGLSAAYRDTLLLVTWGDLSYEEAATALSVPTGTIRSRINRARAALRRKLGDLAPTSTEES
jgi:RNA polymerase sigma factor (sigma-70 family)